MKNKTKFKLFLVILILAALTFVVIQIIRFYRFINSGTLEGTLWGIGAIAAPFLLLFLYFWISGEIYQHDVERHRARIAKKRKECEKEEEEERKRNPPPPKPRVLTSQEKYQARKRERAAIEKAAIEKGICLYCNKPASNLNSSAVCSDCDYDDDDDDDYYD